MHSNKIEKQNNVDEDVSNSKESIIKSRKILALSIFAIFVIFIGLSTFKILKFNSSVNIISSNLSLPLIVGINLIIYSFTLLFTFKNQIKVSIIIYGIINLILIIDSIYFRYFSNFSSLFMIKQLQFISQITDSTKVLFNIKDCLSVLDFIIILIVYIIIRNKIRAYKSIIIARIFIFWAVLLISVGVYLISYSYIDDKNCFTGMYDKTYVLKNVGDIGYHIYDTKKFLATPFDKKLNKEDLDKLDGMAKNKDRNINPEYKGKYDGYNLIMVQLESFQGFVINKSINGQELTPNLNKLVKDSAYFPNCFTQISTAGTSDAEFLTNTSTLPLNDGSVYYLYPNNKYETMANMLDKKGYYTAVLHANDPIYWNRNMMYKSMGFQKFESAKNFDINDNILYGLSDKSFLKQSVDKMKQYPQPFYSFLITLTSHYPFSDEKLKNELNTGKYEGTFLGDYFKSVHYTDSAIGDFIQNLKDSGLWDKSIVVFYGDHYACPIAERVSLAKYLYGKNAMSDADWQWNQKVVSMMHFPKEYIKGTKDNTVGEIDMMPTLGNLMNFDINHTMGEDMLNSTSNTVFFKNGNFINGTDIYFKNKNITIDSNTGNVIDNDKGLMKKSQDDIWYSENIVRKDALNQISK